MFEYSAPEEVAVRKNDNQVIYLCGRCSRQVRKERAVIAAPARTGRQPPCSGRSRPSSACPGARLSRSLPSAYLRERMEMVSAECKKEGAEKSRNLRINSGENSLYFRRAGRAKNTICTVVGRIVIKKKEVYPFLINLENFKNLHDALFSPSFSSVILSTSCLIFKISFATR